MILQGYPDYTKSGFDINSPCPEWKWPNMIIHNKTRSAYYPLHTSPLTVKFTIKGEEYFATKQKSYRVTPDSYLIFNNGQKYSARIQTEEESETISVFFRPKFAEETLLSLITSEDMILENETLPLDQPVNFIEMLYPQNSRLLQFVHKFHLASRVGYDDDEWLEEELFMFLKKLLEVHRKTGDDIKKIPAVKSSTRVEVFRRLNNAREFLDDNFSGNIKIEDAAKAACMSNFHFLRLFKKVFGETPYQYITKRRVDKAFSLILRTGMPITEVCFEVGFSSPSSFSWLFKQKYGMSPETMRGSYNSFAMKLASIKK